MKQLGIAKPRRSTPSKRWSLALRQLCERLDIIDLADEAVLLVKKTLKPRRICVEAGSDPEGESEWLIIRAEVRGSVDEVLSSYSACKKEWLRLAPSAKQARVRFLYDIH